MRTHRARRTTKRIVPCLLAAGLALGCESYDPPEEATPTDTIAPAPGDAVVPGADDPGPEPSP